jgi:hypothetical protein
MLVVPVHVVDRNVDELTNLRSTNPKVAHSHSTAFATSA